ncbi:UNVERIFIED_ORG: hypothetical protein J2X74_000243 [Bacillus sp. 1751]|nr:hypothetical protein [Bacillus sp. 1751]
MFDIKKVKEGVPKKVLDEAVETIIDLKLIMLHTSEMSELAYSMSEKADFSIGDGYVKYEESKEDFRTEAEYTARIIEELKKIKK